MFLGSVAANRRRTTGTALTNSTAPTLAGDPVVGQRIFATNGTYNATPDTIVSTWTVGGTVQDETTTTFLILDIHAGLAIGYSEIAQKAGFTDSPTNSATSTASVTNVDLTNAITALSRTSASGVLPMTADITFGSNVYEGYILDRVVYTDSALTIYKSTNEQNSTASHTLTHADLQAGATIDWSLDGGPAIAATDWLRYRVRTTSPNGSGYMFAFGTPISPTDAVIATAFDPANKNAAATLRSSNLNLFAGAGNAVARVNKSYGGAKYYAEFSLMANNWFHIIIADSNLTVANAVHGGTAGTDTHSIDLQFFDNFDIYTKYNASTVHNSTLWLSGQPVDVCWNDTMFWWRQNNAAWMPTGSNPSAGTGGVNISSMGATKYIFGCVLSGGEQMTINPGTTPGGTSGFVRTPPTGAIAP